MKKTILLAALLCLGFGAGFVLQASPAHAATVNVSAPSVKDAADLKSALDALQGVLNVLQTKLDNGGSIADTVQINNTLSGVARNLSALHYALGGGTSNFADNGVRSPVLPLAAGTFAPPVRKDQKTVAESVATTAGKNQLASLWLAIKARRQVLLVSLIIAAFAVLVLFRRKSPEPVPESQRTHKPFVRKSAL